VLHDVNLQYAKDKVLSELHKEKDDELANKLREKFNKLDRALAYSTSLKVATMDYATLNDILLTDEKGVLVDGQQERYFAEVENALVDIKSYLNDQTRLYRFRNQELNFKVVQPCLAPGDKLEIDLAILDEEAKADIFGWATLSPAPSPSLFPSFSSGHHRDVAEACSSDGRSGAVAWARYVTDLTTETKVETKAETETKAGAWAWAGAGAGAGAGARDGDGDRKMDMGNNSRDAAAGVVGEDNSGTQPYKRCKKEAEANSSQSMGFEEIHPPYSIPYPKPRSPGLA
jgi:hypothetical protein